MRIESVFKKIILLIVVGFSFSSSAQVTSSAVGNDFWLGYMRNYSIGSELQLHISSTVATSGTISVPGQLWSTTFTVVPNVITIVDVPGNFEHLGSDIVDAKGVHVTSVGPISVLASNFRYYSTDATKVVPVDILGTDYIVTGYESFQMNVLAGALSEFLIVATEDDTEVEIIPACNTVGGHAAGVPYYVQLNQGQSYQVEAMGQNADITGTRIKGTQASGECRPFAVFGGCQVANVHPGTYRESHIFDQILPIDTWETEFYTVPLVNNAIGNTYRIIARDNGTTVSIDGAAPIALNSGQFVEFNDVTGASQILGSAPISVVQYMQGGSYHSSSNPSMVSLSADNQKLTNATFSTILPYLYYYSTVWEHRLNVVVETQDIGSVTLDGIPVPASEFTPYNANPFNSYAQIDISVGVHELSAPNGFSAYLYGVLPGGNYFNFTYLSSVGAMYAGTPAIDSFVCVTDTVVLSPPVALLSPEWVALSDTVAVIGTSNDLTLFPPIINDGYTVSGISSISGCPVEYTFGVAVPSQPSFAINASEDTICMSDTVQIDVVMASPGNYEYLWTPVNAFTDPTAQATELIPPISGWYSATATEIGNPCNSFTDSIYITIDAGVYMAEDTTICPESSVTLDLQSASNITWSPMTGIYNPTSTTPTISPIQDQLYIVDYESSQGCSITDSIQLNLYELQLDLGPDTSLCDYDTLFLDAGTPFGIDYLWSTGSPSPDIEIVDQGEYSVDVTDINGCVFSDTIEFTQLQAPAPSISGPLQYCNFDTVIYETTQSYNDYLWMNDSTTAIISQNGNVNQVSVQVTNVDGCIGFDTIDVQMVVPPTLDLIDELLLCDTNLTQVTAYASGAYNYEWSNGLSGSTVTVGEGVHIVEAQYATCLLIDSVIVTVGEVEFSLGENRWVCQDNQIFFAPETSDLDSVVWFDGTVSNFFEYSAPTDFKDTIEISAVGHGCGNQGDTVLVFVEDCSCPVYIPNTITPNGDEHNNTLRVSHDCRIDDFTFTLFDRWGAVIFETSDPDFSWEGTNQYGQPVQIGTYVWKMVYRTISNTESINQQEATGHLNVIR